MQPYEPNPSEVRSKIEEIKEPSVKMFCKALYILCATASELSGVPSRNENAYGPYGNNFSLSQYHPQGINRSKSELVYNHELTPREAFAPMDIAVFSINMMRMTKRKAESGHFISKRFVALPLDSQFEFWTNEIVNYYKQAQTNRVFNFNRRYPLDYIRLHRNFDEFGYTVEHSLRFNLGELNNDKNKRSKLNKYRLDGLRYTRRKELKENFGFSDYELGVFEGTIQVKCINHTNYTFPNCLEET
jgi:hypothetical protein